MKFSELISELAEKYTVLSKQIVKDGNVYYIDKADAQKTPDEDALTWSDNLCDANTGALGEYLLWSGDSSGKLSEAQCSWAELKPDELHAAVAAAEELLRHEYKSQSLRVRVMEMIMYGKGLDAIVDAMAKELNINITIIDMSGKIITHSHPFTLNDSLWIESVERGFCPPFFIKHIYDLSAQHGDEQNDGPRLRHCKDNQLYYLAKRIRINGELYGYVFMLQKEENFSTYCGDVLSYISYAATEFMLKNINADSVKNGLYNNLLIDIFRGIPSEQINARIYAGEMKFPNRMCIAAVKPRFFQGTDYVKDDMPRTLRQMFPRERYVYYNKMMVILFGLSDDAPALAEEDMSKLLSLCEHEHLICGVSNPFSTVTSMKYYYEQAVKAIELNGLLNLPENLYEYKNVALYDLINNVAQSRKVGFYCHPALLQLMEYDKQNGSQLYETLGCLARNGFNSAATATEMFLHRNTLSYRKQKIAAMTGIDLDDFNTQFMLKYSYMIEEYIDKQSGTKL